MSLKLSISHHLTSILRTLECPVTDRDIKLPTLPTLGQRFPNPPGNRPRLDYSPPPKKTPGNSVFQPEGLFDTRDFQT